MFLLCAPIKALASGGGVVSKIKKIMFSLFIPLALMLVALGLSCNAFADEDLIANASGPIYVGSGATCTITGGTVNGDIDVDGGSLYLTGGTVKGNINLNGTFNYKSSCTLDGKVNLLNTNSYVTLSSSLTQTMTVVPSNMDKGTKIAYSSTSSYLDTSKFNVEGLPETKSLTVVDNYIVIDETANYTITISARFGGYVDKSSGIDGWGSNDDIVINDVPYGTIISFAGNRITIGDTNVYAHGSSGYSFDYWYYSFGGNLVYDVENNDELTVTSSMTIYANFKLVLHVAVEEYKVLTPYDLAVIMCYRDVCIEESYSVYDNTAYMEENYYEAYSLLETFMKNNTDPFDYLANEWGPENNVAFIRYTYNSISQFGDNGLFSYNGETMSADLYFSNTYCCGSDEYGYYYDDAGSLYDLFNMYAYNKLGDIDNYKDYYDLFNKYGHPHGWLFKENQIFDCVVLSKQDKQSTYLDCRKIAFASLTESNFYQYRIDAIMGKVSAYIEENNFATSTERLTFDDISTLINEIVEQFSSEDGYDMVILPEEIFDIIDIRDLYQETMDQGGDFYILSLAQMLVYWGIDGYPYNEGLYNCVLVNIDQLFCRFDMFTDDEYYYEIFEFMKYLYAFDDKQTEYRIWGKIDDYGYPTW